MQSFKQFLTEGKSGFAPWHEQDVRKIHQLIYYAEGAHRTKWNITNSSYSINKNGTVSFKNEGISGAQLIGIGKIPDGVGFQFKYSKVNAPMCKIYNNEITNLWGFPDKVKGNFEIISKSLKSLDHLISNVEDKLTIQCENLNDWGDSKINCDNLAINDLGSLGFKEMYKHIEVKIIIEIIPKYIEDLASTGKGVLGLCRMKLNPVTGALPIHVKRGFDNFLNVNKVLDIVNKNDDIMDCQEELIQAGLTNYAKL